MKKNFYYAMISAALLTGAAGFSACSSDDVTEDTGLPGNAQEVKTEFAINIPRAGKAGRMTAGNTQNEQDPKFLGMEGIHLIPFAMGKSELQSETSFDKIIGLGDIGSDKLTNGVKKYKNVNIPVGTKTFYFYGHAPQGKASEEVIKQSEAEDTRFTLGILNENVEKDHVFKLGQIEFSLVPTVKLDASISKDKEAEDLLKLLNAVAGVEGWSAEQDNTAANKLYNNFIKLQAGSANSILLVMQDLYNAVQKFNTDAKDELADKIQTAIIGDEDSGLFTVGEPDKETGEVKLTWKENKEYTFPKNLHLPEGVARVKFAENQENQKVFSYVTAENIGSMDDGKTGMVINEKTITYPASLYYATASDVAASNSNPLPDKIESWIFTNWDDLVKVNSKSVALKDKVNYGVANFEVKVKCADNKLPTNGTQQATQAAVEVEMNGNDFVTVPVNGFTLTGVLVGGQYQTVDYKFDPKQPGVEPLNTTGTNTTGTYTVYDRNVLNVNAKANTAEGVNYTLVLPTQETDDNINFALEFKNTAAGFYGKDGFIPNGATFYVVGILTKENKTDNSTKASRIFQQDYKTTANVTIKTLKNAYYTLPDLRATNLELGLAVDLEWQEGMVFDVEIK